MATLADLILRSRQHADMVNSTFVEDTEWTIYINGSYGELYDLLTSRFEDYYSKKFNFTLSTSNEQPIPADFYKFRGLDYDLGGGTYGTVRKYNFEDRNKINKGLARSLVAYYDRVYRVMGGNIEILPIDKAPGGYRLWYIPRFVPLVNPSDVCGDVLDFEEYICVDAAIKALTKEESDTQVQLLQKEALRQRILSMAANRDTTNERIGDVTSLYDDWFTWGGYR